MTTNAAKYGALSKQRGTIEITWQVNGSLDKAVELVWQERGGPKVKANAKASAGFGTTLIDRVIRHDLDGKTKIDFDSEGVRWTIAFPVGGPARRRVALPDSAIA